MATAKKRTKTIKTSKGRKTISPEKYRNLNFFGKLKYKSRLRAEKRARQHAQMLATLPKKYPERFLAHFKPKRIFKYWFSLYGLHQIGKFVFACFLLGIIAVGGLFVVYKQSLEDIQLADINISETVNTYYDRTGEIVLWQDTGNADYRLVVGKDEINPYVYDATIAIEDKNFFTHHGVDPMALIRATISTLSGKQVQGGSTLTQQLIKQVYFADEAASANRGGIMRKIKELILALELEKMYEKTDIITMYLNESPYGGRRNGVESAARTYFDKPAKDLTLDEAALLAAIPNNPAVLNPYNVDEEGKNELLTDRQKKVLDAMLEIGKITQEEYDEAVQIDTLAKIHPESAQYENIIAPHFVLEVKKQLEKKYPEQMNDGGLKIITTIDVEAQKIAEDAVALGIETSKTTNHADNAALVSLDVESSQVIAMVGSYDFYKEGYGEVNVTTSLMEPGSTIKPVLDYTPLFQQRNGQNFGPGSILKDENIDSLYCNGYTGGGCQMRNFNGKFNGNVTIRQSLSNSLNIPAVKALYINGIQNSLQTLHDLGDVSYCAGFEDQAGLSISIGSGCNIRPTEHVNTYVSLARGGAYKDIVYVLKVEDSDGKVIEQWQDVQADRVVDEQVAYMISSILSDADARNLTMGYNLAHSYGFVVPGVWTAMKTGTTTTASSSVAKDSWMASYSTAIATLVWSGNHDGAGLYSSSNTPVAKMTGYYMEHVHKEVYAPRGDWHSGDQPVKPAGIKNMTVNGKSDIWPSWYNASSSGVSKEKLEFNKYTKKLASACTPAGDREAIEVTKIIDPVSKNATYFLPEGYDKDNADNCNYQNPTVSAAASADGKVLTVTAVKGTYPLSTYTIVADGTVISSGSLTTNPFVINLKGTEKSIKVTITDSAGSEASSSLTLTPKEQASDEKE